VPIFKRDGRLHSNQIMNFITTLKMMVREETSPAFICEFSGDTDAVRMALQRSPSKSTRKTAAQLRISRLSVQQILKSDLNLYQYKMTVLRKLTFQKRNRPIKEWHLLNGLRIMRCSIVL
jgi:hypothetical protein